MQLASDGHFLFCFFVFLFFVAMCVDHCILSIIYYVNAKYLMILHNLLSLISVCKHIRQINEIFIFTKAITNEPPKILIKNNKTYLLVPLAIVHLAHDYYRCYEIVAFVHHYNHPHHRNAYDSSANHAYHCNVNGYRLRPLRENCPARTHSSQAVR